MNTKPAAANIIEVPAWVVGATIYEAAALMDCEDKWIRMTADDQRAIFGGNVFGKQAFFVNSQDGTITVTRKTCFGMDSESHSYTPATVRAAVAAQKKLSPGVFGPAFFNGQA